MNASNLTRWGAAAVLGAALSVSAGTTLAPAAHAAPTKCGDLKKNGHVYAKKVAATNISCKKAKQTIYDYFLPGQDLNGYKCKGYPRQTCKKGRVVIAFTYP